MATAHRRVGGPATAGVLANAVPGLAGFGAALLTLHLTAVPLGSTPALIVALGVSVGWNTGLYVVRRRESLRLGRYRLIGDILEIRHGMPYYFDSSMPTIRDFGGYKVTMYAEDHNPPHVHAIGPDFQAVVRIADAEVLAGAIPVRHRREAVTWIAANRESLMEKWNELK